MLKWEAIYFVWIESFLMYGKCLIYVWDILVSISSKSKLNLNISFGLFFHSISFMRITYEWLRDLIVVADDSKSFWSLSEMVSISFPSNNAYIRNTLTMANRVWCGPPNYFVLLGVYQVLQSLRQNSYDEML